MKKSNRLPTNGQTEKTLANFKITHISNECIRTTINVGRNIETSESKKRHVVRVLMELCWAAL